MPSRRSLNVNRFLPSTAKPRQGKSSPLVSVAISCLQGWHGQIFLAPNLMSIFTTNRRKNGLKRNNGFFFLPTFASRLLTLGDSFNQLGNCFTNQKTWEIFSIKVSIFFQKQWFHLASRLDFALGAPLAQLFGGSCARNTYNPPQHFIDRCRLCLCLWIVISSLQKYAKFFLIWHWIQCYCCF